MISKKINKMLDNQSAIRLMFSEGIRLKKELGEENVFDFTLGNPSLYPPDCVKETIDEILKENPNYVHGYMNNAGYPEVRKTIAESLNSRFKKDYNENNIIMTVGAAGALNVLFKTLLNPEDEVIAIAPYFMEYRPYVENYDGKLVVVPPNEPSFHLNVDNILSYITEKTQAVIINNPNNPSGVVYSGEEISLLAIGLNEASKKIGHPIYLISDEPYRELAYDNTPVPYLPDFYDNSIVVYSYSKTLSLPGERIGYITIPNTCTEKEKIFDGAVIANRILGFVNSPSLMQLVIQKCVNKSVDISLYDKNRKELYKALTDIGYECVKPEGAFYLFLKSPFEDESKFVEMAKNLGILFVAGTPFGAKGYVRVAYCVSYETIINSIGKFKELYKQINK